MDKTRWFPQVTHVVRLLAAEYPLNRLGHKTQPLDELAFLLLSDRTSESNVQAVYDSFKERFPRWSDVADASLAHLASAISLGGLARQKARYLRAIARKLRRDFGRVSLRALADYSTPRAEAYLCSLPGVGIKTARSVLMFALDRPVFPAGIHCLRVMARLGWIDSRAASSRSIADSVQPGDRVAAYVADLAQAGVPPRLRHPLHVLVVQHGQTVCRSRPDCGACAVSKLCPRIGVEAETPPASVQPR